MKTGLNVVCLFKAVKYLGTITEPFITHEHVSVQPMSFRFLSPSCRDSPQRC